MTPEEYRIKTVKEHEQWLSLLTSEFGEEIIKQLSAFGFAWLSKSNICHDILVREFQEDGWLITTGWFRSYISEKPLSWFDRMITPLFAGGIL